MRDGKTEEYIKKDIVREREIGAHERERERDERTRPRDKRGSRERIVSEF